LNYIKSVLPMKDHRLLMEMEGGSTVIVDLSGKLHTVKYSELAEPSFFNDVSTDGNYVIWRGGRLRITVNELMEIVLLG